MRRLILGFIVRLIASAVISFTVWWLFVTPFDRLPLPASAVTVIVRLLDFPVALAGEVLPIRGMELVFDDHGTWCDFCSVGEMFRQQMRIAIPTYLLLFYVPTLLRRVARRDVRVFKRIVIGLLIYAAFTAAYFLFTGDGDRRGDVRIAAMWFLILSAAAAFAWSKIERRWRFTAVVTVLLAGAWAFAFMMTFIAPKMDEVRPYFVSYLVLLIFGVGGTLLLTWVIENLFEKWRAEPAKAISQNEISKAPIGICRLCKKEKYLRDSHFLPKAFYKLLLKLSKADGQSNPNPVVINADVAIKSSKQVKDYLLCGDCEALFSKNGEQWVVENCWHAETDFPLRKALEGATPICEWKSGMRIYAGAGIAEAGVTPLLYFAASIFWRGAAHDWSPIAGKKPLRLTLGDCEEMLRLFLLGDGPFPKNSSLVVTVSSETDDGANELILFPWMSNDGEAFRQYRFVIPGIAFQLFIGEGIPPEIAALSTAHRAENPIYLGSHEFVQKDGAKLIGKATPKGDLA